MVGTDRSPGMDIECLGSDDGGSSANYGDSAYGDSKSEYGY